MTEDTESMWKDCNCMNCRLARIEDQIEKIMDFIDTRPEASTNPTG
jgi:hypothetical protein